MEKKWIKVTEELTEGPNFFDLIMKSIKEAAKRGIEADSIVINRDMVFVPELFGERPPMVCGLNAYLTKDDLPDMYSFAVIESQREKTNADRIRAMSDEELAVFLADKVPHGDCCNCFLDTCTDCRSDWLEWLKQPADQ